MTLKEKFRDKILSFLSDNMKEQNSINCELIADEFAIGFAQWYFVNSPKYDAGHTFEGIEPPTNQRLLEIYKKEKGL
jgi:hypothetical protein